MGRIFGHDSPIVSSLTKIGDIICVSALWIVFSLPIFTIGASTVALYTVVYRNFRSGKGYVWKTFWDAFRAEFKRSTLVWLVSFAVMALLTADVFLFRGLKLSGSSMGNLYWAAFALWWAALTWTVYLLTYAARINGGVRDTIRYGYLLMVLHPIRSLGILITLFAGFAIVLMVPFMVLAAPAVVMLICSFPLEKTFLAHQPPESKAENEDQEDNSDSYSEIEVSAENE